MVITDLDLRSSKRDNEYDECRLLCEVEGMEAEQSSGVNINDVIEVIETDEMYAGGPGMGADADGRRPRAHVKITEQPASKALRFRYECEGRSAGSIPGVNSTHENKTYPGIQIVGYHGRAVVVVSCVTKDPPYRPHPHNLVGKEGCNRGVCTMKMATDTITFSNLGIQCVKKKDIEEALKIREEIRVDPFRTGFSHKVQPSSIDLNSVRLCFQVFLEGPKKEEFTIPLRPIVSNPIYDKKAMSDLTICKLSDCSATVAGGKEIILLCEKVAKEDIQVRFYEERDGELCWEGQGDFQPTQVHKQVAISFKTPKYKNIEIDKPVNVYVQLRRPSDGAVSESVPFQFIPLDSGRATFWSLHRALTKKGDFNTFSNIININPIGQESQKRKLDAIAPLPVNEFSDVKKPLIERDSLVENKKDSLISGGNLLVLPQQQQQQQQQEREQERELGVYEKEAKAIHLGDVKAAEVPEIDHDLLITKSQPLGKNDFEDNNNVENETDKMIDNKKKDLESEAFKNLQSSDIDDSQSFNDLITQVAELDEIYSENKERLALSRDELEGQLDDSAMDCREMFDDIQTYTSLQMAMKNPLEMRCYEDVIPIKGPIINVGKPNEPEEKLPPLPPKRVKKTPPRRPEAFPHGKALPKVPDNKARAKQSIFLKLFSKKKNDSKERNKEEQGRFSSSTNLSNLSLKETKRRTSLDELSNPKNGEKSFSRWFQRGSTGNISDDPEGSYAKENLKMAESPEVEKGGAYLENYTCKNDFDLALDLTEAENYALYTAMAPHATASEFDEMSFYYSPVEGGKILNEDNLRTRIKDIDLTNLDPVMLKRKRQKYDGESSPQNIWKLPQDDESRSTYVGSLSPERGYNMLQVKREPSEHSPISYNYGGSVSPNYASGTSPGSLSPHNTPSPVPCTIYTNLNSTRHSGGGIMEMRSRGMNPFKPDMSYPLPGKQQPSMGFLPVNYVENDLSENEAYVHPELGAPGKIGSTNMGTGYPDHLGDMSKTGNDTNRSQLPGVSGMDHQQCSLDINTCHLDSAELARMAMMTDANLSENLSSNLTLDDKTTKSGMDCDQNMTHSSGVANSWFKF